MSHNLHSLSLGEHGNRKMLLCAFSWRDSVHGTIQVPSGFLFDGATIPRLAWTILGVTPYDNRIIHAAVIHDWLYCTRSLSRKHSDRIFRRIMEKEGRLSRFAISLIYRAVRIGGCKSYNKTRQLNEFYKPDLVDDYNHCGNA